MIKVIREDKDNEKERIILKKVEEEETITGDFFNLLICLTSITRKMAEKPMLNKEDGDKILREKQKLIKTIAVITDILNLDKECYIVENKKKLKEAKPAEYFEYDVIPLLRFQLIQENLKTVIDGYNEFVSSITYEQTRNIATDLTIIENAIDNIATIISNEFSKSLIYKEV